jgi:release factor glutamine methyltransferase
MDLSLKALEVAKRNALRHELNEINWLKGDLRKEPFGTWTVIVSNPPYIPTGELEDLQPDIRYYEPRLALDGGKEGLDYLIAILDEWSATLAVPGLLALETHGPKQVEKLRSHSLQLHAGRAWSIGPHFFFEAV